MSNNGKNDLVQRIGELAKETRKLARVAEQQYSTEVEAILKAQSRDSRRIERRLDGILDFCFDDGVLVLYKKLCRYYFNIDPQATVSYVNFYRDMWNEQPVDGPIDGEPFSVSNGHTVKKELAVEIERTQVLLKTSKRIAFTSKKVVRVKKDEKPAVALRDL